MKLKRLYMAEDAGGGGGTSTETQTQTSASTTGSTGTQSSFADSIKDVEIRDNVKSMFPDIKDFDSLAKTAVHQQRMLGKSRVEIPAKDAKPEVVKAFYVKNFGVPEKEDGYKFDKIVIPEGFGIKTDDQKKAFIAELKPFAKAFHSANLNEAQATEITNAFYQYSADKIAGEQVAANDLASKSRSSLQQEWGGEFEARMNRAELALSTLGGQEFADRAKALGLHNDAAFIKFLSNAGELMKEDRGTDGLSPGGFATGPNQAQAEIDQLMGDPVFLKDYRDSNSPNHNRNQERIRNLYEIKNGERGRSTIKIK